MGTARLEPTSSAQSATPGKAAAHRGRLTRLLLQIAVLDCVVTVIVRTVSMLATSGELHSWQLAPVKVAGSCATIALPFQCVVLWLLLMPVWRQQSGRRRDEHRINAILKSGDLEIAFQPVRSTCTGQVVAVEALARFPQEPRRGPDEWFAVAGEVGLGVELELLALRRALSEAARLAEHLDVAVNLSPCALNDPRARDILLNAAIRPRRLIVEITEHCAVSDYDLLGRSRSELRDHGIRLAIDDAGSGYASFQHIVKLTPDVIKLDRALISGVDTDPVRLALVKHMVGFAAECSARTVAEGVETAAELACVEALLVDQVQGYWTGKPTTSPTVWATWTPPVTPTVATNAGRTSLQPGS